MPIPQKLVTWFCLVSDFMWPCLFCAQEYFITGKTEKGKKWQLLLSVSIEICGNISMILQELKGGVGNDLMWSRWRPVGGTAARWMQQSPTAGWTP